MPTRLEKDHRREIPEAGVASNPYHGASAPSDSPTSSGCAMVVLAVNTSPLEPSRSQDQPAIAHVFQFFPNKTTLPTYNNDPCIASNLQPSPCSATRLHILCGFSRLDGAPGQSLSDRSPTPDGYAHAPFLKYLTGNPWPSHSNQLLSFTSPNTIRHPDSPRFATQFGIPALDLLAVRVVGPSESRLWHRKGSV